MTQQTAAKLIEQNLTAIYGYTYGKLYDKSEAEDLSHEIILEILRSAENIKTDAAFWGFAWKIAENTFRKFIKRRQIVNKIVSLEAKNSVEILVSPEQDNSAERDELIYRLRRELSLLGKRHREVCIDYYVYNKSCSFIAKERGISTEMVKQHLFKARRLLKEGMKMERRLGEKSYNPGTLKLDFWGNRNFYNGLCDKKLPGAILLAAYNRPMTAKELSVELGVAMPYLEEEIDTLETAGLLLKNGKKYETDIIIITDEYEKKFTEQTHDVYAKVAQKVFNHVKSKLSQIRSLDFHGNDFDDNRLLFGIINIALINGYFEANSNSPIGQYPKLPLGCEGWVWGYDNNYINRRFQGVALDEYNQKRDARFSALNYCAINSVQALKHFGLGQKTEALCDAILEKALDRGNDAVPWLAEQKFIISKNERIYANFPVFRESVYNDLLDILKPATETVAKCMIDISGKAEIALSKTVPLRLRSQCVDIAKIHHRFDAAAFIVEELLEQGMLILPKEKTPICVYGVKI